MRPADGAAQALAALPARQVPRAPRPWWAGAGGTGVVIIQVPLAYAGTVVTTGSPTVTVTASYTVYKFTATGRIKY